MAHAVGISARGLSKRFGSRVAFEGLSFEVSRGEIFGFLGPNGAGKTTTVRVLSTLLAPSAGSAEVAGIPVGPDSGPELRRRISVMTEAPGLYLKLSLYENLAYFAGLYDLPRREIATRIAAALESVGLAERAHDPAGSLSKGLRQRASLARALLNDPQVIFLDEPTSGLDPEATVEVRELVEGLRSRGATVFLTTHRLEEAERICDRVAILKTRLLMTGKPSDLRSGLFEQAIRVRLAKQLFDPTRVFTIPGVKSWSEQEDGYLISVEDAASVAPVLARALVKASADILQLTKVEHSLEDVYLEIMGEVQ